MSDRSRRVNQGLERGDAASGRCASPVEPKGLAVEGPGFFVWDEIASDARRRAAELLSVARGASERSP